MSSEFKQSKAQADLAKRIYEDYIWAKDYRSQFTDDWDRYYRMYRSKISTTGTGEAYPFESQLFIPYVFTIIETQLPLLMQQMFGSGRFVEASGRKVNSEITAPDVAEVINYQFERDLDPQTLFYLWAKQTLMLGTGPMFGDWKYLQRETKARVPRVGLDGSFLGEQVVKLDKVIANNPIAKNIDLYRYFQCPGTPGNPWSDPDVLYAGFEFQLTKEELNEYKESNIYNNNVNQLMDMPGLTNVFQTLQDRLETVGKIGPDNIKAGGREYFPCIAYWGLVGNKGHKLEMHSTVVCYPQGLPESSDSGGSGEGLIIKDEQDYYHHGRIPIELSRVNHTEGELYGIGDVEMLESLQTELTDQRNQRADLVVQAMNPMFKSKNSDIDSSMLEFRPNGIIPVDDPEDLTPLRTDLTSLASAFQEESVLKQDMQFTSGISDFIAGTFQNTSGFNDTATGISLIQQAAQNRLVLKGQFLQVGIKHLAEMIWALDQQFLPFNEVFRILDPMEASRFRFVVATPEHIAGQYDFSIASAPAAGNPQVRQNQMLQLMQSAVGMLPLLQQAGTSINMGQLFKRFLKEFNIPNIAQILPDVGAEAMMPNIPEGFNDAQGPALDPEVENNLMLEGEINLPVNPGDDDMLHIIVHKDAEKDMEGSALQENIRHQVGHGEALKQKQLMLRQNTGELGAGISQGGPGLADTGTTAPNTRSGPDRQNTRESGPGGAGGAESLTRTLADQGALNG